MKITFLFSWKMESIYGIYIWNLWQTREDGKKIGSESAGLQLEVL